MKRKGRYNIKIAREKGVTTHKTSGNNVKDDQIKKYLSIQDQTTSRDGFRGHDFAFFRAMFDELKEKVWLFESFYNQALVSAAILTLEPPRAVYYFGASSSDRLLRPTMAPYQTQWEMIQHARAQNCTVYDFTGISPVKKTKEKHAFDGITQFKQRFGGQRITTAPGKEIVLRKRFYLLYRLAKALRKATRLVR